MMDTATIRTEVENLLRNLDVQNTDWKAVVGQCRDIVANNSTNINDFNVKVGRDLGKYQFEIVVPMVFKF